MVDGLTRAAAPPGTIDSVSFLNITRVGHVAHILLDNPSKLNALGTVFWTETAQTLQALGADPELRVVLLRGAGRAFTAGLDIPEVISKLPVDPAGGPPDGSRQAALHRMIREMQGAITAFERLPVPVIAAVHGYCLGAGVDLITACDIRLASADATFGVRETKLAMVADVGTLQRLPRIVGPGHARELTYTGRDFDATYAEKIGLVNRVLPDPETLFADADALAQEIAANPPLAVRGSKHVLGEAERYEIDRGLEYVATYNAAHLVTQDLGVAITAALTKQKPEFGGR